MNARRFRPSLLLPGMLMCLSVSLCASMSFAQDSNPAKEPKPSGQIPSLDLTALDRNADPCVDFYQFSCGGWMKNNPIPPDQATWSRFNELRERNRAILHGILEKAAEGQSRTPNEQKTGDYYSSCMDEAAINEKGIAVLRPEFDRINSLADKNALPGLTARLHQQGISAFFDFGSEPDFKNAKEVIAGADQVRLALPDRDYYLKDDPQSVELRKAYVEHVANMLKLLGDAPEKAAAEANAVMAMETALAKGSLDRVSRRDPANVYHKMSAAEWQALAPSFSLPRYLADMGLPQVASLNVAVPDFFKALDAELQNASLD